MLKPYPLKFTAIVLALFVLSCLCGTTLAQDKPSPLEQGKSLKELMPSGILVKRLPILFHLVILLKQERSQKTTMDLENFYLLMNLFMKHFFGPKFHR